MRMTELRRAGRQRTLERNKHPRFWLKLWRRKSNPAVAFRFLLDGRTWRRHSEPFSKTDQGRERREERRFVLRNKYELIDDDFLLIQEGKLLVMDEMRREGWLVSRRRWSWQSR